MEVAKWSRVEVKHSRVEFSTLVELSKHKVSYPRAYRKRTSAINADVLEQLRAEIFLSFFLFFFSSERKRNGIRHDRHSDSLLCRVARISLEILIPDMDIPLNIGSLVPWKFPVGMRC